ncbi:MAG: hypothetical protein GEU68_14515, partial [Actinobacteria bacterium]|nr:hypothetical protein [Actinomycetota bacterium]
MRWLVEGASKVVDLGVGTGKLTSALSRYVTEVLALEPQHQMLLHLQRAAPSALVGLGLIWNVRDESIDWVAELARIAGPENSLETRAQLDRLPGFRPFE